MRIVTVGDNCMDVYLASGKAYPGGNPVNVSVYLKALGATTSYVGWVGSDQYGKEMMAAIKEKGVDITHLLQKDGKTAITHVELVGNDRKFGEYDEGVMADFVLTDDEIQYIRTHQFIHSGIWGHTENYFPIFKENGMQTSFDFSDQLDHDLVKKLPPFVDYSFFSYSKDDPYIRDFLVKVKGYGSKVVIATLGENGSLAYDGKTFYQYGILEKNVVDTMGAGDSFIAGFIFGILKEQSIYECLKLGTEVASKNIQYFGAW